MEHKYVTEITLQRKIPSLSFGLQEQREGNSPFIYIIAILILGGESNLLKE